MTMKTYRIFFDGISNSHYDVSATSKQQAVIKAQKEWRQDHKFASLSDV